MLAFPVAFCVQLFVFVFRFVEFGTVCEADTAIQKLDQADMGKGIKLRVRISESKGDREKRLAKKQEENSFLSTLSTVKHTISNGHEIEDDMPTDSNIPKINNRPLGMDESAKEVKGKPASPWSTLNKSKQQTSTPDQSKSSTIWDKPQTHNRDDKAAISPLYTTPSPPHYFTKSPESQPSLQSNSTDLGNASKGGEQVCAYCKNPGKKRCVACKTHYCSKECQTNDWPSHKLVCKSQGGKTTTRQTEPVDGGIDEDFHLSVPSEPEQISKLLGLQPTMNDPSSKDQFQSTDAKNFTSLSSNNSVNSLPSGVDLSVNTDQVNNEANLPPLPPETPPDSPPQSVIQHLPSIKSFSCLPSSFPVCVLRASASNSVYIQVQCQEVQKASDEFKAMIKSGDFQPQQEHTLAKNRCCIVKTKGGQFKIAKIRTYKKNAASVMTTEALFEVIDKENIFTVPQIMRCLMESIFKFQLYDVMPFEGTNREEASRYVESLTVGKLLTCTAVASHTDLKYVNLTDPSSGESINTLIGESDYAVLLSSMSSVDPGSSVVKVSFFASSVEQHFPLVGKHIEILPQAIINPNMIWVQENHAHIANFKQLSVDMNVFFAKAKSKTPYQPTVGELCAACCDHSWHRAEVLSVSGSDTCNIMLIDIGIKMTIACSNLKHLEEHRFTTLPRQAFLVSLSGVQPIDPSGIWEDGAIEFLKNRISGARVGAEVVFVRGNIFSVRMIDPMSVDSLTVNQLLVSEGFAKALLGEASPAQSTATPTKVLATPTKVVTTPTALATQPACPFPSSTSNITYYQSIGKPSESSKENSLMQSDSGYHADKKDSLKSTRSQVSVAMQDTDSSEVASSSFSEHKVEEKISPSDLSSHSSTSSLKQTQIATPNQPKLSPAVIPSLETEWKAMVSYSTDPKNIWVIPTKKLESFGIVLCTTEEFCSKSTKKCLPQVGISCLAPFENHYYRCEVVSIEQPSVNVRFADFGNTETVKSSSLLAINDKLCEIPSLAIQCELDRIIYPNGESKFSEDCEKFFQTYVSDKVVHVQVHKNTNPKVAVSMTIGIGDDRVDLSYELVKRGLAAFVSGLQTPLEGQSPEEEPSTSFDLPKVKPLVRADIPTVVLPKSCQVGITSVDSPSQFWAIHVTEDSMSKLDLVNKELNDYATSSTAGPLSPDHVAGCLCCACFSEDNTWYRAELLSFDGSNYTVRFLDYGNQCTAKLEDMRVLPSSFLSHPAQAVQCTLHGIHPLQGNWSAEAVSFLKSNTQSAVFSAKSHGDINSVVMLELVDSDGQSLAEQMISAGVAKPSNASSLSDKNTTVVPPPDLDLPTSGRFQTSVTFAVSPLEFWVQSKDMEKQQSLNTLMETLQSFYSDLSNHHHISPAIGSAYCSKYEDGFYYRCKVVEIFPSNGTVKVLYIDFGNSSTIQASSLLQLQPQFTTFNNFAAKCSLSGFSPSALNPAITKQFVDMILGQVITCAYAGKNGDSILLELYSPNGHSMLDVLKKIGANINPSSAQPVVVKPSVMPSSATQVLVSASNSPSSIFVQIVTSENHKIFAKMTEQLQSYCSKASPIEPSVDVFCSAMFKEDRSWYRAKVLSVSNNKAMVMYVDFGNQAEVPCQYIKPLSPDLAAPAAFALEVSLSVEPTGGPQWSQASKNNLQQLIENKSFLMKPLNKGNLVDFVDEAQQGSQASVTQQLVSAGVAKEKGSASSEKPSGLMNGHPNSPTSSPTESCSALPQQCSDMSDVPAEMYMVENMNDIALEGNKESYEVLIIHIASLSELYAIATDHVERFGELINKVQAQAEVQTHFNRSLVPGELCLAKFSEDNSWYRAEVVKVQENDGMVVVRFVDFGNNDTVSLSSLLPVSKELSEVPLVSFTCALYGVPYAAFSDANIVKALNSMTQSKKLLCKIVNHVLLIVDISDPEDPSGLTLVEQLCYPGSLRNISASDNIRVPLTIIPTDDYMVGMVTEAKGPREFYMQVVSSKIVSAFQKMCAKLEECRELAPATDPIYIGQLVCSLSTAYNTCYRSRIIGLPSDKEAMVHYVDFGNQETIPLTQIWPMKNEFQYIPFMSVRCCLVEYENIRLIPSCIVEKFLSLVTDKQLQVRRINAQPPYGSTVVELVDTTQATDVVIHKALKATAT